MSSPSATRPTPSDAGETIGHRRGSDVASAHRTGSNIAAASTDVSVAVDVRRDDDQLVVQVTVNGTDHWLRVPGRLSLADALRERLHLTGTHLGCEHGVCGACTVLVDGIPARSCITLAAACDGCAVVTVEGLEGPVPDAVREAFAAEHGLQCGFCTPGMLVTAVDIVTRRPEATADDIRLELGGNLCRCTGYVNIVRAILRAADQAGVPVDVPDSGSTATTAGARA